MKKEEEDECCRKDMDVVYCLGSVVRRLVSDTNGA